MLDGMPRLDDPAQLRPPVPVERPQALGEPFGDVTVEAKLPRNKVVEDGVRRDHGEARGGRLVDHLVRRARAHVVHEDEARGEQLGHLGPRHGPRQDGIGKRVGELAAVRLERLVGAVRLDTGTR